MCLGMCCKSLWHKDLGQARPAACVVSPYPIRLYGLRRIHWAGQLICGISLENL
jgi:hypothetical protein